MMPTSSATTATTAITIYTIEPESDDSLDNVPEEEGAEVCEVPLALTVVGTELETGARVGMAVGARFVGAAVGENEGRAVNTDVGINVGVVVVG